MVKKCEATCKDLEKSIKKLEKDRKQKETAGQLKKHLTDVVGKLVAEAKKMIEGKDYFNAKAQLTAANEQCGAISQKINEAQPAKAAKGGKKKK